MNELSLFPLFWFRQTNTSIIRCMYKLGMQVELTSRISHPQPVTRNFIKDLPANFFLPEI